MYTDPPVSLSIVPTDGLVSRCKMVTTLTVILVVSLHCASFKQIQLC